LGAGVIAVLASSSAEATSPKEADHGRLSIVTQPAPIPRIPLASDRLATLDPEALSADPADPRRQTLLADQGDFDTPISTEAPDATPPENPQPVDHSGGTSSKEDKPDPAPG
jgi:hypothetical protein